MPEPHPLQAHPGGKDVGGRKDRVAARHLLGSKAQKTRHPGSSAPVVSEARGGGQPAFHSIPSLWELVSVLHPWNLAGLVTGSGQ